MKKYSTSKLLVAFVIVSLLSLPYAFADKPDKPGKPEPVWSVYIPFDPSSGLQGILDETPKCTVTVDDDCPEALLNEGYDEYYVYNGDLPTTRNLVWKLRQENHYASVFHFEIAYDDALNPLAVQLYGIENACIDLDTTEGFCEDMFEQIGMPQPSGEPFPNADKAPDWAIQRKISFNFQTYANFDYNKQEIGPNGTYYFDRLRFDINAAPMGESGRDNLIDGAFSGFTYEEKDCSLERISDNTWHITCSLKSISASQRQSWEPYTVCVGKRCRKVYTYSEEVAEGTAVYDKSIDLYFVYE